MATGCLLNMIKLHGEVHAWLKIYVNTFQCEQRPPTSQAITGKTHKTPSHAHEAVTRKRGRRDAVADTKIQFADWISVVWLCSFTASSRPRPSLPCTPWPYPANRMKDGCLQATPRTVARQPNSNLTGKPLHTMHTCRQALTTHAKQSTVQQHQKSSRTLEGSRTLESAFNEFSSKTRDVDL